MRIRTFIALFGIISFSVSEIKAQPAFRPEIQVNDDSIYGGASEQMWQGNSNLVVRGDTVYTVYAGWKLNGPTGIYFDKSTDGGNSFGTDVMVCEDTIELFNPCLCVDPNGVIYCSFDWSGKGSWLSKSTNGGESFSPPNIVSDSFELPNMDTDDSGNIYLCGRAPKGLLYFTKSTDGGATFTELLKVGIGNGYAPYIKVGNTGNLYIVFAHDSVICLIKSTDGGNSFGSIVPVFVDTLYKYRSPLVNSLVVDGNENIYVGFTTWIILERGIDAVFMSKSTDEGESFSPPVLVVDSTCLSQLLCGPSKCLLAVDSSGSNIYAAWNDFRPGPHYYEWEIYFTYSTNGGDSFAIPFIQVNKQVSGGQVAHAIVMDRDGVAYLVWYSDPRPSEDLDLHYFTKSANEHKLRDTIFADDFNDGILDGWLRGGVGIQWDTTSLDYHSSPYSITDSPGGNYKDTTDTWIAMKDGMNLSNYRSAVLYCWIRNMLLCSYLDFLFVEASTDGGTIWDTLRVYAGVSSHSKGIGGSYWPNWHVASYNMERFCGSSDVRIRFRLVDNDTYGTATDDGFYVDDVLVKGAPLSGVEETKRSQVPEVRLFQNRPNPFTQKTVISYQLSVVSKVSIRIYDISGKLVRNLLDEEIEPGYYTAMWGGENEKGKTVPSGIYFYKLKIGDEKLTKKMIKIR